MMRMLCLLLALAAATFACPAQAAPAPALDSYRQAADGDDYAPAFRRYLAAGDPRVDLECGRTYVLRSTVNICKAAQIRGCGLSTFVVAAPDITAFAVRFASWCAANGTPGNGYGTSISGFWIRQFGTSSVPRFGVLLEATAHVEDLRTWGFTNGIRIDADVQRAGAAKSGANQWTLNRVRAVYADHAGVLVRGGDSNVGVGTSVDVTHNCWHPERVPVDPVLYPPCAGLIDASFLGNTWIGLHSADTGQGLRPPAANVYPGAAFIGPGQRSVCLGCYREADQLPAPLSANSIALGGLSSYTGGGVSLHSRVLTNVTLRAPTFAPLDDPTDRTPPLFFLRLRDGSALHVEQDGLGVRSSYKGANSLVGWRWLRAE
jgi:hypothetical protein